MKSASPRGFPLKFDGNPPAISNLTVSAADRRLDLTWQATADDESAEIVKTPGLSPDAATLVLAGPDTSFTDNRAGRSWVHSASLLPRSVSGTVQIYAISTD